MVDISNPVKDVKNTSSEFIKLLSLIAILFLAMLFGLIPVFLY